MAYSMEDHLREVAREYLEEQTPDQLLRLAAELFKQLTAEQWLAVVHPEQLADYLKRLRKRSKAASKKKKKKHGAIDIRPWERIAE